MQLIEGEHWLHKEVVESTCFLFIKNFTAMKKINNTLGGKGTKGYKPVLYKKETRKH